MVLHESVEVFTAVKIQVDVFWIVTPANVVIDTKPLQKEDGASKVLRNVGILPQHHKESQPRRNRLE
jgi:hypothetical protein